MGKIRITLELDEDELKEHVYEVAAKQYYTSYSSDRRLVERVTAEQIRKVIYSDKERLSELIVNRAASHLKNVAAKKMAEKIFHTNRSAEINVSCKQVSGDAR